MKHSPLPLVFLWGLLARALVAKRRSMLYLGGVLSTGLSWMFLASVANMFLRSSFVFDVQLVGSLDSTNHMGPQDVPWWHALVPSQGFDSCVVCTVHGTSAFLWLCHVRH